MTKEKKTTFMKINGVLTKVRWNGVKWVPVNGAKSQAQGLRPSPSPTPGATPERQPGTVKTVLGKKSVWTGKTWVSPERWAQMQEKEKKKE